MAGEKSRDGSPVRRSLAYGLAAGAGLASATLLGPTLLPTGVSGIALAVALGAAGGACGLMGWRRAARLQQTADKASNEIDTLSKRLIRLESRLADLERNGLASGVEQRGMVAELTGEIALLGGLVKDLAVNVSAQERAVAALDERTRIPQPRPAPMEPRWVEARSIEAGSVEARPAEPRPLAEARTAPTSREAPPRAKPSLVAAPEPVPAPPPPAPRPVERPSEPVPDRRRSEAIAQALRADRVDVYLQPVVALPQRKMKFYEVQAHLRLTDDEVLSPAEFLPALERAGLTPELDAKMVARAAALARHLAARGSEALVSCALAPASLHTPGFLRALGRVLESHPDVLGRLVLGISQRCWRTLEAETAGALSQLRVRGVAFALDRATDLRLDPLALADRGVRFLKVPANLLLRSEGDPPDYAMSDFAAVLARAGIRLVAEGVEREGDVPDLIELDVPLAQGGVFAPPRAVRPDVLGGAPPQPPARPAAPPAPERDKPGISIVPAAAAKAAERVPLRSLLRRAL